MGELGMVGIPAAIANAAFHATGKRIRELPITADKLLEGRTCSRGIESSSALVRKSTQGPQIVFTVSAGAAAPNARI